MANLSIFALIITSLFYGIGAYYVVSANDFLQQLDFQGHPVVLVPGDGGSQLEARLNKSTVVHYLCAKKTDDYFDLWLNLELLIPVVLDCFVDNMRLVYDNVTRTTSNSPGVDIRIPGFGNTSTVEWLDPSKVSPGAYFKDIVELLTKSGYQRDIHVRGAPYDFRKGPQELGEFFVNLKTLVEDTYDKSPGKKVVMVAHSMGSPFTVHFLNGQTQAWKDKYIRAIITLAGVWGGAVKAARVFATGDNLGIYVLSAKKLRAEQRTSPSLAFLLPSAKFWLPSEVIVSTPNKNYTVNDYEDYFKDIGYTDGYDMWKDSEHFFNNLVAPGVEFHCLHGLGIKTDEQIIYKADKDFPEGNPTVVYGDGDGTVNVRTLLGCLNWQKDQHQPIFHQVFDQVDHMDIVRHPGVLDYIQSVVTTEKRIKDHNSSKIRGFLSRQKSRHYG